MSVCLGCLVAAGSFAGVSGLGQVTAWWTERRRRRDMQSVLCGLDDQAEDTAAEGAPTSSEPSAEAAVEASAIK